MTQATHTLKLPASVKREAERLAKQDGVSLNQWIAVAVAEKVGVMNTAEHFFGDRRRAASVNDLTAILAKVPDVEPDERDRT